MSLSAAIPGRESKKTSGGRFRAGPGKRPFGASVRGILARADINRRTVPLAPSQMNNAAENHPEGLCETRRLARADVLGAIAEAIWCFPSTACEFLNLSERCIPSAAWDRDEIFAWFAAHDQEVIRGRVPRAAELALWCAGERAGAGHPIDVEWAARVCRSADKLTCNNCRQQILEKDDVDCPCGRGDAAR